MERQKLTHITRGLQHAAAETNSLVSQQYIRVMSEYFDKLPDGSLKAKMVRVELDDEHYVMVPLVSLAAPTGLGLDRMRVELSIKLEEAEAERTRLFPWQRDHQGEGEDDKIRSQFSVSLSPRSSKEGGRASDHVHIELEFRAIETPESIHRVIETYTNMMQPMKKPNGPAQPEPAPTEDTAADKASGTGDASPPDAPPPATD